MFSWDFLVGLVVLVLSYILYRMISNNIREIQIMSLEGKIDILEKKHSYHSGQIGHLFMAGDNSEGEYMKMIECENEIDKYKAILSKKK